MVGREKGIRLGGKRTDIQSFHFEISTLAYGLFILHTWGYIIGHDLRIINCRDIIPGINKPFFNSPLSFLHTFLLPPTNNHRALLSLHRWVHNQTQGPPIYRESSIIGPQRRFRIVSLLLLLLKREIPRLIVRTIDTDREGTRLRTACGVVVGRRNTLASNSGSWM